MHTKCCIVTAVAHLVGSQPDGAHMACGLLPTTASHQRLFTYSGVKSIMSSQLREVMILSCQILHERIILKKEELSNSTWLPKDFAWPFNFVHWERTRYLLQRLLSMFVSVHVFMTSRLGIQRLPQVVQSTQLLLIYLIFNGVRLLSKRSLHDSNHSYL